MNLAAPPRNPTISIVGGVNGWDVSSGSYDADNETLTFDDGVDAYVLTAVYNSVADEDQQLIENKEIFDEQAEKNVLQQKLSASGISLYEIRACSNV